ncbi:MAG: hypothetical protein CMM50_06070 [Rhodospirillaceae bacterium]|nr:hypothetical protein [Rhodospirillaceae bacterium]
MTDIVAEDYAWGESRSDLQAGVRQAPGTSGAKQFFGAIRNVGTTDASSPAICELRIRAGEDEFTLAEGPRSADGQTVLPGETVELFGWRITADICSPHLSCGVTMWCLLGPHDWLRSAEVQADFS